MFRFTGLALGKHRVMLNQPDFIMAVFIAHIGKVMHGLRDSFIGLKAELADKDFILIQNGISVENEKERKVYHSGEAGSYPDKTG